MRRFRLSRPLVVTAVGLLTAGALLWRSFGESAGSTKHRARPDRPERTAESHAERQRSRRKGKEPVGAVSSRASTGEERLAAEASASHSASPAALASASLPVPTPASRAVSPDLDLPWRHPGLCANG